MKSELLLSFRDLPQWSVILSVEYCCFSLELIKKIYLAIHQNMSHSCHVYLKPTLGSFLPTVISLKRPQNFVLHKWPIVHLRENFFPPSTPPESDFKQDVEIVCLNVPKVPAGPTQSNMNKHFLTVITNVQILASHFWHTGAHTHTHTETKSGHILEAHGQTIHYILHNADNNVLMVIRLFCVCVSKVCVYEPSWCQPAVKQVLTWISLHLI